MPTTLPVGMFWKQNTQVIQLRSLIVSPQCFGKTASRLKSPVGALRPKAMQKIWLWNCPSAVETPAEEIRLAIVPPRSKGPREESVTNHDYEVTITLPQNCRPLYWSACFLQNVNLYQDDGSGKRCIIHKLLWPKNWQRNIGYAFRKAFP